MIDDERLYTRLLPGGGYVAIESTPAGEGDERVRVQVFVERRVDAARRDGHLPPVVAEAVGRDIQQAIDELYEIAANNVEVARALQRWQAKRASESE